MMMEYLKRETFSVETWSRFQIYCIFFIVAISVFNFIFHVLLMIFESGWNVGEIIFFRKSFGEKWTRLRIIRIKEELEKIKENKRENLIEKKEFFNNKEKEKTEEKKEE